MEFPATKHLDKFYGASIMEKNYSYLYKSEGCVNIFLDKPPPE